MLNTILDKRYKIIRELGYGGFGTTYLAKDAVKEDSLCAIKKLNPDHADLETAKKLFKREADTLSMLKEVNQIPKFIDYFEVDSCFYIVEEYIEGSSLDNLLSQKWSVENILIFLWDILSVLQLLHSKNIIHRDIKPSNLIQRKKDYKFTIIDFGAVKEVKPELPQQAGTRIYHKGYAPEEQMWGVPQLNSDIHALGMTAIQLLTNEPPKEIIRDECDRAISLGAKVAPSWLIDILNKMVRSDFVERYQSVEEVLKDLGQRGHISQSLNNSTESTSIQKANNISQANIPTFVIPVKRNKLLYLSIAAIPLILIYSELVKPWIRPLYYLNRGDKLLDNNKSKASLDLFQKAISLDRDSSKAWKGRGDALFNLRRYSGALGAYNKAIAIEPNNIKTLNNKAKILYQQGDLTKAISVYDKSIEADANNADAWSGIGLAYMNLQQYESALAALEKAEKIAPEQPRSWIQKGIVLKALQRPKEATQFYQEALDVYDEITTKERNNPLLWTDRGFVLLQLNRPQDAFASYDRALMLDDSFYEALLGKANTYNVVGDFQQSLTFFDRATEVRPQDYQVWHNRGNLLLQYLNSPEKAFISFQQAIKLKPDFYPALLGKGLALSTLQQYSEALKALDAAQTINPQDPFVWMNKGVVLEELQQFEAALEAYETAAIEFKFPPASDRLKKLQQKLGY